MKLANNTLSLASTVILEVLATEHQHWSGADWDNDSGRKNLASVQENLFTYSTHQRAYVLFAFCWIFMFVLWIYPTHSLICLEHTILTVLIILVKYLSWLLGYKDENQFDSILKVFKTVF